MSALIAVNLIDVVELHSWGI